MTSFADGNARTAFKAPVEAAELVRGFRPEGGDDGGHVVAANQARYTGQYLKQVFDRRRGAKAGRGRAGGGF
jgi:hypothetical protein